MAIWKCWLDEASLQRFRQELQLHHLHHEIEVPGEHDLPRSHVRQLAMDSLMVLARQENPELERAHLHQLMGELNMVCEPVMSGGDGASTEA